MDIDRMAGRRRRRGTAPGTQRHTRHLIDLSLHMFVSLRSCDRHDGANGRSTRLWDDMPPLFSEKGDQFGRPAVNFYADERTRTSTRLLPQRPERCASTSSATSALEAGILLSGVETVKQPRFSTRVPLESRAARRSRTRNVRRSSAPILRRRPTGRRG